MPQIAGRFTPTVWTNPRPPVMGAGVSAVVGGGGDRGHRFGKLPGPGAAAFALLPAMAKMAFAIQGPGYVVRGNGASQVMSGPQVRFNQQTIADGVQGIVVSNAYQQGLIDWDAYYSGYAGAPPGPGRG